MKNMIFKPNLMENWITLVNTIWIKTIKAKKYYTLVGIDSGGSLAKAYAMAVLRHFNS